MKRGPWKHSVEHREALARRTAQAVELKKKGLSYAQIAQQLGYSGKQGAFKAVERALASIVREPAKSLLDLELARLDSILVGLVAKGAYRGEVKHAIVACKVIELRARMTGLLKEEQPANGTVVLNVTPEVAAAIGVVMDSEQIPQLPEGPINGSGQTH